MGDAEIGSAVRFVGRGAELGALRAFVTDAGSGHGRVVVIEGDSGLGKSRLPVEAARAAEASGFRVLWGACDEIDQDRPLGPLRVALTREGSSDHAITALSAGRSDRADRWMRLPAVEGASDAGWLLVDAMLDE